MEEPSIITSRIWKGYTRIIIVLFLIEASSSRSVAEDEVHSGNSGGDSAGSERAHGVRCHPSSPSHRPSAPEKASLRTSKPSTVNNDRRKTQIISLFTATPLLRKSAIFHHLSFAFSSRCMCFWLKKKKEK